MAVDTETRSAPLLDIAAIEDDLTHSVCQMHFWVAFCGAEIDCDGSERCEEEEIDCPLCAEAIKTGMNCAVVPGCPGERSRWGQLVHRVTGGHRG